MAFESPGLSSPKSHHSGEIRRSFHVGVVCDMVEENWPSMDLVADMLLQNLDRNHSDSVRAERLCPPMVRRAGKIQGLTGHRFALNFDRLVNRFWEYPKWLRPRAQEFDLFHLIDHSYSNLISELPPGRTIVTCHDLEAFRYDLEPAHARRRSFILRAMSRRLSQGFQRATRVTCDSDATRNELLSYRLFPSDQISVVPNGVHPTYSPKPEAAADLAVEQMMGPPGKFVEVLNVGSCTRRKRLDILVRTVAAVRRQFPTVRLVRVGGPFTPEQQALVSRLGLQESITVLPFLPRNLLAAVYRRATLALLPSEYEGFGLPLLESMASGTVAVGSNIPVFREVGGNAITCCPVGDVAAWSNTVAGLLVENQEQQENWGLRRKAGLVRAAGFTWSAYAERMVEIYEEVLFAR